MLVFVYGSLMKGFSNHGLLRQATFIRHAVVEEFDLYSLGSFPAAVPHDRGDGVVCGEIYEVDKETLAKLDRLEGHPTFYERQVVTTRCGASPWMYIFQGNVSEHVPDGDWRNYHESRRETYRLQG